MSKRDPAERSDVRGVDKSLIWKSAAYISIPLVTAGILWWIVSPPKRPPKTAQQSEDKPTPPKAKQQRRVASVPNPGPVRKRKPPAAPLPTATHTVTEIEPPGSAKVIEALQVGRRYYESRNVRGIEFMRHMRGIAAQLPELKVSTDPKRVEWNVVPINQSGVRFDAYRFRSPLTAVADLYWVFVSPDTTGSWQISGSNTFFKDFHRMYNLRVPGVKLPKTNVAVFQSHHQAHLRQGRDYVLWFARPRESLVNFHIALRVVPRGTHPPAQTAAEIARVVGVPMPTPPGLMPFQWYRSDSRMAAYSRDGRALAKREPDGSIKLEGEAIAGGTASLTVPHEPISGLQFGKGGDLLAVTSRTARSVSIWNTKNKLQIATFRGRNDRINGTALSPDGKLLIAFDAKGKPPKPRGGDLVFWDVDRKRELARVSVPESTIDVVRFLPDGKSVICGGGTVLGRDGRRVLTKGSVSFWDVGNRSQIASVRRGRWIDSVDISPDGKQFLTASSQGGASLWSVKRRKVVTDIPTRTGVAGAVWCPSTGRVIAISELSGNTRFYLPDIDAVVNRYLAHRDIPVSVSASPSMNVLVISCRRLRQSFYLPHILNNASYLAKQFPHLSKSRENTLGIRLIPLQGGRYMMGAPTTARRVEAEEKPAHFVHLSKPFFIAQREVTVGQFRKFVAETGYTTEAERARDKRTWKAPGYPQDDSHPVVCVTWNDATDFCKWLSKREKQRYRLPYEAEWEFACRAGETTLFPRSRDHSKLRLLANTLDFSSKSKAGDSSAKWDDGYFATSPAGAFLGNGYGIRGMLGNVRELCHDWYAADHFSKAEPQDVDGPAKGTRRVVRGGSFGVHPRNCRFTVRGHLDPNEWKDDVGFRVVREASPKDESEFLPADPVARAALLRKRGDFSRAVPIYLKLVNDREQKSGTDDAETLKFMRLLAECYRLKGEFAKATSWYKRCFDVTEPKIAKDDKSFPSDLAELARTRLHSGDITGTEALLKKALKSRSSRLGADHAGVADVHFELGRYYRFVENWKAATEQFDRCLAIRKKKLESDHVGVTDARMELGMARTRLHEYNAVRPLLEKALRGYIAEYGLYHPRVAEAYIRIGGYYVLTGDNDLGLKKFSTGLMLLKKCTSYDHPSAIVVLRRWGGSYNNGRSYSYGEEYLVRAREVARRVLGPHHPDVIEILHELSRCYAGVGKYQQAEECCKLTLKKAERLFGKDHARTSAYHLELGKLYYRMRRFDEAEAAFQRSYEIDSRLPPGTTQHLFVPMFRLGMNFAAQRKWKRAIDELDGGIRDMRKLLTTVLPGLPRAYRYSYVRYPALSINQPFAVAAANKDVQALVDKSAEWAINMKGLVNDVMAEEVLTTRDAKDPATRKLANELTRVRNQMASIATRSSHWGVSREEVRESEKLVERERVLVSALGKRLKRRLAGDKWVTLSEVRKKIPKGSVAIEIYRYRGFSLERGVSYSIKSSQYAAWIIPPEGEGDVRMIDLSSEGILKKHILKWRAAIQEAPQKIARDGEKAAVDELQKVVRPLVVNMFRRLERHVREYDRWIISPDSTLWLIPWGAFPYEDKYLAEKKQISTLISTRVLVEPSATVKTGAPVVVANPDYNLGLPGGVGFGRFSQLPGSAAEGRAIAPSLTKLTGKKPRMLVRKQAVEKDVVALKSPRILVLSTHGYFNPSSRVYNSLLNCGLALAGANGVGLNNDRSNNEGVLTGMEVLSIDLRGTDLVVLSACDTGLGKISQSEGVSGLRQAFRLAGARTVIATLWKIPDKETAALMSEFFKELANGASKCTALQKAQVTMIKRRRTRNKAAHPIYWAAFTVTGHAE